jgi:hypothetical protein
MNIDARRWLYLIVFAIVMTIAFRRPEAEPKDDFDARDVSSVRARNR